MAFAQTVTPAQQREHQVQLARAGQVFLDRTQIAGNEAAALIQVREMLAAIAAGSLVLTAPAADQK